MNIENKEILVNTYTEGNQRYPSITELKNGGFVIVWQSMGQEQDGSGHGIYGQIFNSNGEKIGDEFLINTTTEHSQFAPCVSGLETGGFVVTWTSNYQDGSGQGIFGQVWDSNGEKKGDEFQVNTYTTGNQSNSKVTGLKDDHFVVVWESSNQDGSGYGIFGQIFDSNGEKKGDEFPVNTFTKYSQQSPSITSLENGGFIATWTSSFQDSSGDGIFGQIFDSNGDKIGDEFQVNTYITGNQCLSNITAFQNGNFLAVWQSSDLDKLASNVCGQYFNAKGEKIGDEFQVNIYTHSYQGHPMIASLEDGGFVVTWENHAKNHSAYEIYTRRYDASGNAISEEILVNTIYAPISFSVTGLINGGFVITWESLNQNDTGYGIFARYFHT